VTSDSYLRHGKSGREIADVQQRLSRLAIATLTADGVFDERTEQAVRQFQRMRGLPADGIVGPETWRTLVEAGYTLGDRLLVRTRVPLCGDDVVELQQRLNQLGFYAGSEDGIFGEATQAAVEEFQRNTGVAVDGRVGPETVELLHRLRRAHQTAGAGVRARKRELLREWIGQSLTSRRLLVDPAHGPADPGPTGPSGVSEAQVAWVIASQLVARLNALGSNAFLSRGPHTTPSGSERARLRDLLLRHTAVRVRIRPAPGRAAARRARGARLGARLPGASHDMGDPSRDPHARRCDRTRVSHVTDR
jgi:N-acetylmuramoyl-L-alanine amidase